MIFFKIEFELCSQKSNKRFCAHGHILGVSYRVSISLTEGFSSQGHLHPFMDQKIEEVPKSSNTFEAVFIFREHLWETLRRRFKVSRLPFCQKELAYWEIAQEANL